MHIYKLLLFISTLLTPLLSNAQCNGSTELCNKTYDQVAYLTTHNAYNADDQGFGFPNQNFGITQQLNDGVRALMLDVHYLGGVPTVFHGFSNLGNQPLSSNLTEIHDFLGNNPNEIVTIIFECYVSANDIEQELINSGLSNYLYTKAAGQPWPELQTMIDNNQRLVVFTDADDASANQLWYHHLWDHAVETHFSVHSSNSFTNDFNRGDAVNDLFIFNHFITNATLGIGIESEAAVVNMYDFLISRIQGVLNEHNKFPNFITVDFYDLGDAKTVVDTLNSPHFDLTAGLSHEASTAITISPIPADKDITISGLNPSKNYTIDLYTSSGRLKKSMDVRNQPEITFPPGSFWTKHYILRISTDGEILKNQRIIMN